MFYYESTLFFLFLLFIFLYGILDRDKITTLADYAFSSRNFHMFSLIATTAATWISGSSFFVIFTRIYSGGLIFFFVFLCMVVQILIVSFFLLPKLKDFSNFLTPAELMGNFYGNNVRVLTGICGVLGSLGIIAVQFKIFGSVVDYVFSINKNISIIASGIIVSTYCIIGGIKSVVRTDVIQFLFFIIILPVITFFCHKELVNTYYNINQFDYLNLVNHIHRSSISWEIIFSGLYFCIPGLLPAYFHRMNMDKDIKKTQIAWFYSSIIIAFFILMIALMSFMFYLSNNAIYSEEVVSQFINFVIPNYLKIFFILAILCMSMSTADSNINSISILFSHDIFCKFALRERVKILYSKVFSGMIGILAIYLAISNSDLLSMIIFAESFYIPIITVPLLLLLYKLRFNNIAIYFGMIMGFTVSLICKSYGLSTFGIVLGMFFNFVSTLIVNLFLYRKTHKLSISTHHCDGL